MSLAGDLSCVTLVLAPVEDTIMLLQPKAACSSCSMLDSPEVQKDAEVFASSPVQTIDTSEV